MSKLEDLIAELCPDGVEYKELGQNVKYSRGKGLSKESIGTGNNPIILYGELYTKYGDYVDDVTSFASDELCRNSIRVKKGSLLLPISSTTKEAQIGKASVLRVENVFLGGDAISLLPFENILSDFLMYVINSHAFEKEKMKCVKGTTISHLDPVKLLKIKVPVPPLEVQREIVRVLDNFTFLTAELSAELSARKKQYDFYSSGLFPSIKDKGIKWIELGSVASVTKLAGFEFTKYVNYSNCGKIIALRGLNVKNGHLVLDDVKYIDQSNLSMLTRSKLFIGDMLFTYVGTVGQVALIDENDRYYLAPNVALIRIGDEFLPEYMMYYFLTWKFKKEQIYKLLQSSSMQNIPMEKIRKFKLPQISLEEQKQVVSILSNFDGICNDITDGIPAEIDARHKQYEYYRDKLLSFKEKMSD